MMKWVKLVTTLHTRPITSAIGSSHLQYATLSRRYSYTRRHWEIFETKTFSIQDHIAYFLKQFLTVIIFIDVVSSASFLFDC